MNQTDRKILLQGPGEAMPVNDYITVTASELGEDEFAFEIIDGDAGISSRTATTCTLTSNKPGESILEAADKAGNTAKLTLRFFDVPK